ncbi:MAG: alpha-galactosidase [Clostridia bacterium]|nr:alpha-galactosidase [Clostridia bacterium]
MKISNISAFGENNQNLDCKKEYRIVKSGIVNAVYVDIEAELALSSEIAAAIDFKVTDAKRFMANWRHKEFWCSPAFVKSEKDIPNQTQGLFAELSSGEYTVMLPVVSENYKCTFIGTDDGFIRAELVNWYKGMTECKCLAFLFATGDDPYKLIYECARVGAELLGNRVKLRNDRKYPEIFEYLGWCSWDAFEIRVDEESFLKKCDEFSKKGIPVKWAILDDMWGEVHDFYGAPYKTRDEMFDLMHSSHLYSFKADPKRFPNGLKSLINKANDKGIRVGIWHPTTGYWKGIDKSGDIYRDYKDVLIDTYEDVCITSFKEEKAYKFYSGYHDYLASCGADFVKIDNQSMTRRYYKGLAPVGQVARQFHSAMERSVKEHFDGKMINCMGMANEDMWNRSDSPLSRCSDDFQPENRPWFAKHILQCTYNCLVQGQFYFEDFDMWWTDDGQAKKNSILRAVSGGPIYVSDKLDRSKADILKPLCLSDGRILRCDNPAVPTKDCLFCDPTLSGKAFKIKNTANSCGILAIFNLDKDNKPVTAEITPNDIEELLGDEFGFYENLSGELKIIKRDEKITLTLNSNDDFKLYNIIPLKDGNGIIGLTDKFISPLTYDTDKSGNITLKENGKFAKIENRKLIIK